MLRFSLSSLRVKRSGHKRYIYVNEITQSASGRSVIRCLHFLLCLWPREERGVVENRVPCTFLEMARTKRNLVNCLGNPLRKSARGSWAANCIKSFRTHCCTEANCFWKHFLKIISDWIYFNTQNYLRGMYNLCNGYIGHYGHDQTF